MSDRQQAAGDAVERVLRAERDAEAALERVRHDAQARIDAAHDEAAVVVHRIAERIARVQRAHAEVLAERIEALRARAAASAPAAVALDEDRIDAAVTAVAARLAGDETSPPPGRA